MAYFIADHEQAQALHPDRGVRPGDIVFDCGAHVGVILGANPNYEMTCGRCEIAGFSPPRIIPHYVFYH